MLRQLVTKIRRDRNLIDLLRHSGVMYLSGIISTVLIIVQQITTANLIGAADYGRFATVIGSGALLLMVMDLRTWELGVKVLARPILDKQHDEVNRVINWLTLADVVSGLLCSLGLIIFAPFIAEELMRAPELTWLVQLYGISSPFRMLAVGIPRTVLRMYNYFGWLSWKSIIYGVARIGFISGAALIGLGLEGVVIGTIIAEIVGAVALWIMVWVVRRRETPNVSLWDFTRPQQFGEGLKMMRGLWLSATLWGIQIEVFIPLLALLTTPDQVGIFRSGLDIADSVEKLLVPFMLVLFPQIVRSYEQNSRHEFIKLIKQSSGLMLLLTAPFVIVILLFGSQVFPRLLGNQYVGVAEIAGILIVSVAVYGVLMWTRPALVALGKIRELNLISVAMSIFVGIGLITVAPLYGAIGGAVVRASMVIMQNVFSCAIFIYQMARQKLPGEQVNIVSKNQG